ncbi:MAG: pitrilysin family protein [Myxococcota bacterium]
MLAAALAATVLAAPGPHDPLPAQPLGGRGEPSAPQPSRPASRTKDGPTEFELENGLKVLLEAEPGPPWVAIATAYRAGDRDEPRDRPGLAHLFEHLSFDAAPEALGIDLRRHIESAGGYINAGTGRETTSYYAEVPVTELDVLLRIELQRMANPSAEMTRRALRLERKVVQEEQRLRFDETDMLQDRVQQEALFGPAHPLTPPNRDVALEVGQHRLEDARWFGETFYRPDRAAIAITGSFDAEAVRARILALFGTIPSLPPTSRPDPIPAVTHGRKEVILHRSIVWEQHFQLLKLSQRVPWAAAQIAESLLSRRIGRALLRVSHSCHTTFYLYRDAGVLEVDVIPAANRTLHSVAKLTAEALAEALGEVHAGPEIDGARRREIYAERRRVSSRLSRARSAAAALLRGDPASHESRLAALSEVSPEALTELVRALEKGPQLALSLKDDPKRFRPFLEVVTP